ncbi:energy homeostasis associated [Cricetulus griseus]
MAAWHVRARSPRLEHHCRVKVQERKALLTAPVRVALVSGELSEWRVSSSIELGSSPARAEPFFRCLRLPPAIKVQACDQHWAFESQSALSIPLPRTLPRARTGLNSGSSAICADLRVLPVMGAAISQGALIAIVCNGLVGFLLLLLWVILCWACHSRSTDVDSLSESSPNSSPGPCPEKAPPPQKPSHEGSYLLQP